MRDILSMNLAELEGLMGELGQSKFRAGQIFGWLHQKMVDSFDEMSNLSKALRAELEASCFIASAKVVKRLESKTDGTVKSLLELHDGAAIESVLMKYSHGNSVCVSTQAGCRMGCTFCASGEDFARNLTAGEICAQVYANSGNAVLQNETSGSAEQGRVGGVVLMGCGEPLDNFDAVLRFIELVSHPNGLNIGQRHMTLSTCGLVPQMLKLAEMKLQITLAVSLHATSDGVRREFMPIAKKYALGDLLDACRFYVKKTNRRVTFEYALVRGVNDSAAQAKELVKLLRGMNCHVNLIPVNKARGDFAPTSRKDVQDFAKILQDGRIQTTVRRSLGGDVDGACGQLRAKGGLK